MYERIKTGELLEKVSEWEKFNGFKMAQFKSELNGSVCYYIDSAVVRINEYFMR